MSFRLDQRQHTSDTTIPAQMSFKHDHSLFPETSHILLPWCPTCYSSSERASVAIFLVSQSHDLFCRFTWFMPHGSMYYGFLKPLLHGLRCRRSSAWDEIKHGSLLFLTDTSRANFMDQYRPTAHSILFQKGPWTWSLVHGSHYHGILNSYFCMLPCIPCLAPLSPYPDLWPPAQGQ